ncbi:MAG TPA: RimJ/RimL family protein N-acetyltransferase [Alphaproteobacteria bacterium]|nr:RimJ/RimL family protein N-acetyltransferase [Alphaproteobacteria bacterium]HBS76892.1 RimJ/RimL family protein N-acetyltransferase [Alphaproteobacteria bacterium]
MAEFPRIIPAPDFQLEKIAPTFENARIVFELIDGQRQYLAQWLDWVDATISPETAYPFMQRTSNTDNGNYYIVQSGHVIGSIGVDYSEKRKSGEIGYWLSRDANGRGIMTRAVGVMERFCFDALGVNRVEILVDVDNNKSQAVAQRAGYMREGVLRQSMLLRGVPRDMIMFSKIKSEFGKGK